MILSIRNKLIVLLLIVSVVPISALGLISQTYSAKALADAKHLEFKNISRQIAEGIDQKLETAQTNLKILSSSEIMEKYMTSTTTEKTFLEDGLYATFETYLYNYNLTEICIIDFSGKEIARLAKDAYDKIEIRSHLNQQWLTERKKKVVPPENYKAIYVIGDPKKAVLKTGIPLHYEGYGFNQPETTNWGFLLFTLDIGELSVFLNKLDMQQNGGAYLLDGRNIILDSLPGKRIGQKYYHVQGKDDFERRETISGGLLSIVLVAAKSEYLSSVYRLKKMLMIITGLILLLIVAIIPLLSVLLTKPIYRLRDDILRVSKGDLDYCITVDTRDEIGFLAGAFEQMRLSLKAKILDIKEKKKLAEAANIAKSYFLANVSHEIKTPMNGILGMIQIIKETQLDTDQLKYIDSIISSSNRLMNIVNDILDFSRLDTGKIDLTIIGFNLRIMVEDVSDEMARKAARKKISYMTHIHENVPLLIRSDPGRLRQVLHHLIENAIKFSDLGHIRLEIERLAENDTTVVLRFSITDNGIGIAEENTHLLFEAFSQIDPSSTRQYEGLGLGLAISKRICDTLGGKIGVTSKLGHGSRFWFEIPFEKQLQPAKMVDEQPTSIKGLKILIVDDDHSCRLSIKSLLTDCGCRLMEAESGPMALKVLQQSHKEGRPIDVAIVDLILPKMNGERLGRIIKADADLKKTLLIVYTSMGLRGDANHLQEVGFSAYMTKPIKQRLLIDCIKKVIEQRQFPSITDADMVTRFTLSEDRNTVEVQDSKMETITVTQEQVQNYTTEPLADADIKALYEAIQQADPIQINACLFKIDKKGDRETLERLKDLVSQYDYTEAAEIVIRMMKKQ